MLEELRKRLNENQGVLTLLMISILLATCVLNIFQYQIVSYEFRKTVSVGLTYQEYFPPINWCSFVDSKFIITNYGIAWSSYKAEFIGNGIWLSRHNSSEKKTSLISQYSIGPSETKQLEFWIWDLEKEEEVYFEIQITDTVKDSIFYHERFTYGRNKDCFEIFNTEKLLEKNENEFNLFFSIVGALGILIIAILKRQVRNKNQDKHEGWRKDVEERGFR